MTKRLKKLAHTTYECKYHMVGCPKYRYRVYRLKSAIGAPSIYGTGLLCEHRRIEGIEFSFYTENTRRLFNDMATRSG